VHRIDRLRATLARPRPVLAGACLAAALGASPGAALAAPGERTASASARSQGAVYVMTNEADANRVIAYERAGDGSLGRPRTYATGGRGTGRIRLSSQDPVVLSEDGRRLYVVNVGSDDVSVFAVRHARLRLIDREPSGGDLPYSLTVSPNGRTLYALNNGGAETGNISGFRIDRRGELSPLPRSTRPLSAAGADPAQVRFSPDGRSLVVTEKATNRLLTFPVDREGRAGAPVVHPSSGPTPFGGDFTRNGRFVVTEAFGGAIGQAAASSYALDAGGRLTTISASVRNGQEEVCWTVLSRDDRFAYVTNFGNGTISSYAVAEDGSLELVDPVAAFTTLGELSIRDHGLSENGRYLYAIDITSRRVHAWRVQDDGDLDPLGAFPGLPPTVAGLAAR